MSETKKTGRLPLICLAAFLLSACSSTQVDGDVVTSRTVSATSTLNKLSSADINQISAQDETLAATQIAASVEANQLTVDQLRIYADRCLPNSELEAPKDLDCSELNLRVKSVFRSDDKVAEALVTLNRLGRVDNEDTLEDDLRDGRPGYSLNAQAVAGGLLDTPAPLPPEDPTDGEFEDFLQQNGLTVNTGVIVANPQG